MLSPLPASRDLVLVGGGHTHALVLRAWGMKPLPGARLTLINPGPTAPYSGMLPGHVAGHYSRDALDIDLVRLARFAGARLVLGRASGIDAAAREVLVEGRPPVRYDVASLDVGITSQMPDLPGFAEHAVPAKPLGSFAAAWEQYVADAAAGRADPQVVVIGAGVAGVELAFAMDYRLRKTGVAKGHVTLVESRRALGLIGAAARARLVARLKADGISLREGAQILRIGAGRVHIDGAPDLPFGFCCGAAGSRPHPWLAATPLATTDGFVDVGPDLRSRSHGQVYAVGDCAHLTYAPRPKAGVYAVRQAPVLAHNLRADLAGIARRRYRPQRDYLKLISLGRQDALMERGGRTLAGPFLWRWKDRIDQSFMEKFRTLPAMAAPAPVLGDVARGARSLATGAPLCGGCAAKLGAGPLAAALQAVPAAARADVLSGPGDDAAVLDLAGTRQVITTDHLRAAVEDPWLMAQIAATHALGDIWAMGARPQAALASLTLPVMAPALQTATLREITAAAAEVFSNAGAALVGGHTSQGAELSIGFTVTGLPEGPAIGLSGARPGDALILTKPIGAGTVLAAEMRGRAMGADALALWAALTQGQGAAAARLAPVAHAMTDVTGFGLAGHLANLLQASGVAAVLDPAAVPHHAGAARLWAEGTRSTLWAENHARTGPLVSGLETDAAHGLLFDAETSGGLLAAVPADRAEGLLAGLQADGFGAMRIGEIEAGAPAIRLA